MPRTVAARSAPLTLQLTAAQRSLLTAAKAWWQEGDRALDYLAEKSRQETALARLRSPLDVLRAESAPTAAHIAPILRQTRAVTANRALNRTLETDTFAVALRALLYGSEPLPQRLEVFSQYSASGAANRLTSALCRFPGPFSAGQPGYAGDPRIG